MLVAHDFRVPESMEMKLSAACYSCATRPGDVTIYDLLWMYPTAPRYGCTPLPLTMGAMDVPHCPSLWVYPTAPHHGLVLPSVNYCISAWERIMFSF